MYRLTFLALWAVLLTIVSCQSEPITLTDNAEEYNRNFIKEFGVPDKDHTWNMATRVTANVAGIPANATVDVYHGMPGSEDARLAASITGGAQSFSFDYPVGTSTAYVQVKDHEGRVLTSGMRYIRNGMLNVAPTASRGRGEGIPANLALVHPSMSGRFYRMDKPVYYQNFWTNRTFGEAPNNFTDMCSMNFFVTDESIGDRPFDDSYNGIYYPATSYYREEPDAYDAGLSVADLQSLVGRTGVFHEYALTDQGELVNGKGNCNLVKYWGDLRPDEGVSYRSTGSAVELNYFYGCGSQRNSLGYFFYKDDYTREQIMHTPKYMLIFDAAPWSCLRRYDPAKKEWEDFTEKGRYGNGKDTWNWALKDGITHKFNNSGMLPMTDVDNYKEGVPEDDLVRYKGTTYRLVFFPQEWKGKGATGHDANYGFEVDYSSPSYEVPEGWNIGFFLISNGFAKIHYQSDVVSMNELRFSLPWMNHAIGQTLLHTQNGQVVNSTNHDLCAGMSADTPPCWFVSYKWGNELIMGVEDKDAVSSDHDMNDILFKITGVEPGDPEEHDMGYKTTMQSWVIACEDLGNTYDYDFNDLVFAVSHISSDDPNINASLFVTPLASGGTLPVKLCYNGTPIAGGKFWHELFGESKANTIINAIGNGHNARYPQAVMITENVPDNYSLTTEMFAAGFEGKMAMGGFSVEVYDQTGQVVTNRVTPPMGSTELSPAPQMLLLPETWSWPRENIRIQDAYPETAGDGTVDAMGGFAAWCANRNFYLWSLLNPVHDNLFRNLWNGQQVLVEPLNQ